MAAATPSSVARGPCIALIAHDGKKADMVAFASKHFATLSRCRLVGTGTTGGRIAEATGLTVERMLSGPMGGDAQIGALVSTGFVTAVVFLVDPLTAHPHEPDIQGLLRLCNVHGVMLATNTPTADAVVADVAARIGSAASPV
jgi:methylglyoxal synthase